MPTLIGEVVPIEKEIAGMSLEDMTTTLEEVRAIATDAKYISTLPINFIGHPEMENYINGHCIVGDNSEYYEEILGLLNR